MMVLALAVLAFQVAAPVEVTSVALRGRVVDAHTGEPIAKATVSIPVSKMEAVTDAAGLFVLPRVPRGEVEIVVTTIGYGVARKTVFASEGLPEVEIRLGQEALKRSEEVVVEAPPFDPADAAAPAAHTLRGVELRNLGGVLTDDPLRSVQSLPGIATGDDFYASFATRGSGFSSAGFYLDGVLMSAPFHTIRDVNDGYSLTILNGDVVESLSLIGGGAPARYGDRTGAVLDVQTREGNRDEFSGRASLGASGLYSTLEGPIGRARKSSWLLSARKSYLDYVLDRIDAEAGETVGYYDVTARLAHHPTPAQTLGLTFVHGESKWKSVEEGTPPSEESARAGSDLGILQWRHDTTAWRVGLEAFATRETARNLDQRREETFGSESSQRGLRADLARGLGPHRLEGGLLFRALDERAAARDFNGRTYLVTEDYDAAGGQWGGYLQDTVTAGSRLSLTLGARFDHFDETGESRVSPRAAASFVFGPRTRATAGYGDYAQFPAFAQLYGRHGNPGLDAERSRHFTLGLEQRLGNHGRLRVDAYDQEERGLLFARAAEARLEGGRIAFPQLAAPLGNVLRGRSRGVEVMLQRRSANGLSGWVAYSYGTARRHDEETGTSFDSDFDQRHTVTAYGSMRLSETLNLSLKYRYGSGFPVAGFYRPGATTGLFFLSDERNTLRPDGYGRLDVRANKAWLFRGWKLTLFAEVLNALDRENARYNGADGIDFRTGRVFLSRDTLFPVLPSLGITADF
jgi:outer membrane cobalamin receptor